jgi:hypothetical protein
METLENMNVVETPEVKNNNIVETHEVKSSNVVEMDIAEIKPNNVVEMDIAETEVKSNNIVEMDIVETEVKDVIEDIENMEIDSKIDLETVLLETTDFINNLNDEKINKENLDREVYKKYRKNGRSFNVQIFKNCDSTCINALYNWMSKIDGFNKELMEKTVKVISKIENETFTLLFGENNGLSLKQQYNTKGFLFLQNLNENDKKRFLDWAEDVVVNKIPVIQPPSHQRTLSRAEINLLRLQERSKQPNQPNNQQNNNWNSYQPVQSPAPSGQRVNNVYNSSSRNPNNPNGRNISVNNRRRRNVPMSEL